MHRALSLALIGLAAFLGTRVSAETLTWQQSVEEARRNNAAIHAAEQNLDAARNQVGVSESANLPQVNANLGARYGDAGTPLDGKGDPTDTYEAGITLSQSLFNGWLDKARIERSKIQVESVTADLQIAQAQVSADLKRAFANLVYAQRAIRLQENIRDRRKANLDLVDLRFQNGSENKGSVLLSRAYLDQAELSTLEARNSIDLARTQLARALGRDQSEGLSVDETIPALHVDPKQDFGALAAKSPQSRQARYREQSSQSQITESRAGYYPTLSLSGNYGRQDEVFFPERDSWSVGLSLNIPIFQGGRAYHSTQSAISTYNAAVEARRDVDRQLLGTLRDALNNLLEAKQRVQVQKSFLAAAEMRAEIGRSRYNNGLLSFEDWDLIESELITRQQSTIQSQRDYVLAEAAWENAVGEGSVK